MASQNDLSEYEVVRKQRHSNMNKLMSSQIATTSQMRKSPTDDSWTHNEKERVDSILRKMKMKKYIVCYPSNHK